MRYLSISGLVSKKTLRKSIHFIDINLYSRKGTPYDNSCIESFHAALKKEEVYQTTYHSFKEARLELFLYIEGWYNRKRIHGAIGYRTPQQAEDQVRKQAQ